MSKNEKIQRWCEFLVLYVVLPVVVTFWAPSRAALSVLWIGGLVAWGLLRKTPEKEEETILLKDVKRVPVRKELLVIGVRFVIGAAILTGLLYWLHPERLLFFPMTKPRMWLIVLVAYPVLSVFPQVIIYRLLFIRRYSSLFAHKHVALVVGALVFSWVHLSFRNPMALAFTLVGGFLFLHTYQRTRSVWLNILEHSLYGDFLFTIGWGYCLVHGGTQAFLK